MEKTEIQKIRSDAAAFSEKVKDAHEVSSWACAQVAGKAGGDMSLLEIGDLILAHSLIEGDQDKRRIHEAPHEYFRFLGYAAACNLYVLAMVSRRWDRYGLESLKPEDRFEACRRRCIEDGSLSLGELRMFDTLCSSDIGGTFQDAARKCGWEE